METPDSILAFWFGSEPDDAAVAGAQSRLWWGKDATVDAAMGERFTPWVDRAARGELDAWRNAPRGRLALILLADQFPRNIHRGTAAAFALDPLARRWCREGLTAGADRALRPIERVFFYLPLEHSESLDDQEDAVALYRGLMTELDARLQPVFAGFLDYALRHRDVVARFGRFPHRNRLLGRPSTAEEEAFLATPGSSF